MTSGHPRRWCSEVCRARANRPARQAAGLEYFPRNKIRYGNCAACGEFICRKSSKGTLACGKPCRAVLAARRERERYARDAEKILAAQKEARRQMEPETRAKYRATRKRWIEANPEVHAEFVRTFGAKRRAQKLATQTETIYHRDVFVRDAWCCGICAEPVDSALKWPHPDSASLDHIQPLSLGGTHTWDNVRLAHLNCNVRRGNRVEEVTHAG